MKIGIIGCGRITELRHAPEAAALPDVALAGFCDWRPERAAEFAARFGGRAYPNAEALLADPAVGAVVVASNNATHAELSIQALTAGKHVLCEKPMALTAAEGKAVAGCAAAAGRVFMVAQNQRFDVVNRKAKQLLEEGAIGEVLLFRSEFSHGGPEAWSVDGGNTMYFSKASNGLGAIGDLGIHKLDLLRWLLADEFTGVSACLATLDKKDGAGEPIPLEDNALLTLHSQKGARGTVLASWTNYGHCESSVTLYGTAGWLHVSDTSCKSEILLERRGAAAEHFAFSPMESSGVLAAFAKAVQTGESPVDAGEGLRGLQLIEAALASAKAGGQLVPTARPLP